MNLDHQENDGGGSGQPPNERRNVNRKTWKERKKPSVRRKIRDPSSRLPDRTENAPRSVRFCDRMGDAPQVARLSDMIEDAPQAARTSDMIEEAPQAAGSIQARYPASGVNSGHGMRHSSSGTLSTMAPLASDDDSSSCLLCGKALRSTEPAAGAGCSSSGCSGAGASTRPYSCRPCGLRFSTLNDVRAHWRQRHGLLKCCECNYVASNAFDLKDHYETLHVGIYTSKLRGKVLQFF